MKKLITILLTALFVSFSHTIFAVEINRPFTVDFSQVHMIIGNNVDWTFYNSWYLAWGGKVNGAPASGWNGVSLEELTKGPYVDHSGMDGRYTTMEHVGLTRDAGGTFTPSTPPSCLVKLRAFDVLHVFGTLHIPGNNLEPYIDNLNCHLN